jgi:hypothetical protein
MTRPAARTGSAGWVYRSDAPASPAPPEVRSQKSEVRTKNVERRTTNVPRAKRALFVERAVLLPVALTLMTALLPVDWFMRRRR